MIPIELFGSDHWTLFLRVEDAALKNRGYLHVERLNIAFSKRSSFVPGIMFAGEYPTQVKMSGVVRGDGRYGVRKVDGYDDIDCLGDLERSSLVSAEMPTVEHDQFIDPNGDVILDAEGSPLSPFDAPELLENAILKHTRWSLTEYGTIIAFQLHMYKNSGKPLHSFVAAQPHGAI
jgi:hypothetical protein